MVPNIEKLENRVRESIAFIGPRATSSAHGIDYWLLKDFVATSYIETAEFSFDKTAVGRLLLPRSFTSQVLWKLLHLTSIAKLPPGGLIEI